MEYLEEFLHVLLSREKEKELDYHSTFTPTRTFEVYCGNCENLISEAILYN
jgi:hypothetical protein